jgi:hypothetical protein
MSSRGAGAELAQAGGQAGESDHGGPAVERPCGFPRYMPEGVHVDEFEVTKGEFLICHSDNQLIFCFLKQACSRLIIVCQTFAHYSVHFTRSANQAITAAADGNAEDGGSRKRWDVLNKFETNFNHWLVLLHLCHLKVLSDLDI